jgi:chromosomal replication initiator protein
MREHVGRAAYEAWFERLEGRSEGEALVILCPDRFTRGYLESRYGAAIQRAASAYKLIRFESVDRVANGGDSVHSAQNRPKALQVTQNGALEATRAALARAAATASQAAAEAPQGSFATFVAGPPNVLALAAARAVAAGRAGRCNPLVITGGSGVGKTHLCRAIEQSCPERALYRSSEQFTIEVTAAMRGGAMDGIRHRYRRVSNLLILDDIQFLEGKPATQAELFHTIEHLLAKGRSIVVSADRPLQELDLDPKLRSRLGSGLIARIGVSDIEMARGILRAKAAHGGLRVPDDCIELLAAHSSKTARDVVSALNQVVARSTLLGRPIDVKLVRETLAEVGIAGPPRTLSEIIDATAQAYGLTADQLMCRSRRRTLVMPRHFAMYLCRRLTQASLAEIGRAFCRDHTTVMHGLRTVEARIAARPQVRYELEALAARLGAPSLEAASGSGTARARAVARGTETHGGATLGAVTRRPDALTGHSA